MNLPVPVKTMEPVFLLQFYARVIVFLNTYDTVTVRYDTVLYTVQLFFTRYGCTVPDPHAYTGFGGCLLSTKSFVPRARGYVNGGNLARTSKKTLVSQKLAEVAPPKKGDQESGKD